MVEIDDDQRLLVFLVSGNRIDNPVSTHLLRVLVEKSRQSGLYSRLYDKGLDPDILAADLLEGEGARVGYDRMFYRSVLSSRSG